MCLNKLYENQTCSLTVQCFEPMTCTTMCQCDTYQYHNISTLTCVPQKTFNKNCNVDFNCRVDKYLQCSNSTCQCIPEYPMWSYGYDKCIVPHTYSEPCYSTTDCQSSQNLVCNDGTYACTCPTKLKNGYCDCVRSVSNEYFWDGTTCQKAHSYNQPCTGSFMCMTMTEGTYCNSTYGICKCNSLYYYSYKTLSCQSQVSVNQACTQFDACRTDLGLICQLGVCLCNSTIQFWSVSKCINYYTYNQGICSSNSQCAGNLICRLSGTSCTCPTAVAIGFCDCPPRSANSEYYWNSATSTCTPAGYYNDPCSATYQCQYITKSLVCSGGKCICGGTSFWGEAGTCISCAAGWVYSRGFCFKAANYPKAGSSAALTQSACGNSNAVYPDSISSADAGVLSTLGLANHGYYTSTAGTCCGDCPVYNAGAGFSTHPCDHLGQDSKHQWICQYQLV